MADVVKGAIMSLLFDQPFFGSILLKRKPIPRKDIPTAGVDKLGKLYYNPDWFGKLSPGEARFVLAHEAMHVVLLHAIRIGSRDPELWNIAGDAYINAFLKSSEIKEMPEGGVDIPGSENKTTEQIYEELRNNAMKQAGGQSGSGDGGVDPGTMAGDLLNEGNPTPEEIAKEEIQVKLDVADAAKVARMQGRAKGGLSRLIDDILYKKIPWYEILARFFNGFVSQDQSWKRPNRRFSSMGAYLPVTSAEPSMGTVVVGIDTSGSISDRELAYFGGHLNAIFEQCHPEKVVVVYCDSAVNHVEEFSPDEFPVTLKSYGGGGTDMCRICEYIEDNNLEPDVCVILTDGYTPFPDSVPCATVWGITTEGITAPVGETVYVETD